MLLAPRKPRYSSKLCLCICIWRLHCGPSGFGFIYMAGIVALACAAGPGIFFPFFFFFLQHITGRMRRRFVASQQMTPEGHSLLFPSLSCLIIRGCHLRIQLSLVHDGNRKRRFCWSDQCILIRWENKLVNRESAILCVYTCAFESSVPPCLRIKMPCIFCSNGSLQVN